MLIPCAQDELSSNCDELLGQFPGESHQAFMQRRQLWTLGVATVWLVWNLRCIFTVWGLPANQFIIVRNLGAYNLNLFGISCGVKGQHLQSGSIYASPMVATWARRMPVGCTMWGSKHCNSIMLLHGKRLVKTYFVGRCCLKGMYTTIFK